MNTPCSLSQRALLAAATPRIANGISRTCARCGDGSELTPARYHGPLTGPPLESTRATTWRLARRSVEWQARSSPARPGSGGERAGRAVGHKERSPAARGDHAVVD